MEFSRLTNLKAGFPIPASPRHSQCANHARTHTQQSSVYKFVKHLRSPSRISRDFIRNLLSLATFILPERFLYPSLAPSHQGRTAALHSLLNHARTHTAIIIPGQKVIFNFVQGCDYLKNKVGVVDFTKARRVVKF